MKNNKGITLIALVVTIIVLLILAGVSIAMLTGQNGILNRASEASYESKLSNVAESMSYDVTEAITAYYNKTYVNSSATDTTATTIGDAIKAGITKSISSEGGKATADSAVSVNDGTTVTSGTISGTVVLTYSNHTKTGTVTDSGISWGDVQ